MLYIFDLDGTIRATKSGKPCPNDTGDQAILPGVKQKMRELQKAGGILVACTNQGGVSHCFMSEYLAWQIAHETNELLDCMLDDIRLCCFHPAGPRRNRFVDRSKPRPDMILELLEDFAVNPKDAIFVGNEEVDRKAAEQAGVAFSWAHVFFGFDQVDDLTVEQKPNGYFVHYSYEKQTW